MHSCSKGGVLSLAVLLVLSVLASSSVNVSGHGNASTSCTLGSPFDTDFVAIDPHEPIGQNFRPLGSYDAVGFSIWVRDSGGGADVRASIKSEPLGWAEIAAVDFNVPPSYGWPSGDWLHVDFGYDLYLDGGTFYALTFDEIVLAPGTPSVQWGKCTYDYPGGWGFWDNVDCAGGCDFAFIMYVFFPDFSMSLTSPLTAAQGTRGTTTVAVASQYGFEGPVDLSVTGQPPGVGVSWDPSSSGNVPRFGGWFPNLNLDVGGAVAPADYPLTVTGTSGSIQHSAPLTLRVTAAPTQVLITGVDAGQGSVSPNCPSPTGCQQQVGAQVTVTANPAAGWSFSSWSTVTGGVTCPSNPSCTFGMPNNQVTVKATFTQQPQTQSLITGVQSGQGSVAPNCPDPTGCQETVGSQVTVTASPAAGWSFSSWSVSGVGLAPNCQGGLSGNPCIFSMPNNPVRTYAVFTQSQILITGVDSGQGSVTPNCPGPGGCQEQLGSQVSVAAIVASGWSFSAWSITGASCSGDASSNPCTFTMPNNQVTAKATFTQTGSSGASATSLSIDFTPPTVDIGSNPPGKATITVTISPNLAGKTIILFYSKGSPNGPWTQVPGGTGQTDASGKLVVMWNPPETGTYYLRADFSGDSSYQASTKNSDPASLNVIPEFPAAIVPIILLLALAVSKLVWGRDKFRRPRHSDEAF